MEIIKHILDIASLWALPFIILVILITAFIKKVPVYETFVEGAKEGVNTTIKIVPYLTAIIVAVAMFRASGCLDFITTHCACILAKIHLPAEILPLAIIRSLSGSAALGLFSDIAAQNPVDSFTVKLGAIMLGSSETTFYVLAVYFGSVGIKKYRYALATGLIADFAGIVGAIVIASLFFR